MSQTVSEGAVGPGHWRYMATVMTAKLDELLGGAQKVDIPAGILDEARQFFKLALEAQAGSQSSPSAAIANYLIATETLEQSAEPPPSTTEENVAELRRCAETVEFLPGPVPEDRRSDLQGLSRFFEKLKEAGDAEAYEERVSCVPSPIGLYR